ncbi:MAG TPA: membrane protein insertion efficiency factor YidD [Candidatus Paceibacterota bacterium]|nr:membrane protein insertion efficiency factor YidD [Candidatus Paceibacterota bacterium]
MIRAAIIYCIRVFQAVSHAAQAQGLPLLAFTSCRQWPTCSEYAIDAIRRHGTGRGSLMAVRRIMSCHPFATNRI